MRPPRYGERSLAEVLPSVAAALGCEGFVDHLDLGSPSQVVLVLIDGLGHQQLAAAAPHLHVLSEAVAQPPIDAAFPTTTPAGLASLALGLTPGTHGFVGATFELPDFERVLNPLRWIDDPTPEAVQPEPNVFERMHGVEVRSHGPAAYADSGMTRTLLGSALSLGYTDFDPQTIEAFAGRLDYVYLPQLDKTGHVDGPLTDPWLRCLQSIDAQIAVMLRRLPAAAVVVVTSDHGMVDVPDAHRIDVDAAPFASGVRLMAGEPRMRHLYTDDPEPVRERWANLLGDRADVLLRSEAIGMGLFGVTDDILEDRIGDVLAIATGTWAMTSPRIDPRVSALRGLHGGLTEAELLVPGLVLRGVA